MLRTTADALVIGAGVVGCAVARELAAARLKVVAVERESPGAGASGAAAGILAPQVGANAPSPILSLGLESRAMFPQLVDELRSETGIDVPYRAAGTLSLALDAEEEAALEKRFQWQTEAGLPVERISCGRVSTLEPAISTHIRTALRFPYDHQIENVTLIRALTTSAEKRGVQFRSASEVTSVLVKAGMVEGVAIGPGRIYAPIVVVCSGAWSGLLETGGPKLPVTPVRGQMLALESDEARIDRVIMTERGYLVPRIDGRIIVGSTSEQVGFDTSVTVKGIATLMEVAGTVVPSLHHARISGIWAGLRPATSDGLPILGPAGSAWPDGLYFATGHYRNGVLLAPLTARLLSESITSGKTSLPLEPFRASRFHA
jgi:glycine oxidase